ncbi:PREDICTED: uncharacterized protein LOC104745450 isoform X2 [Camelina sativa]|uniref:Uncharacterized protein LOC104745450 isoform X2 n=1 Tax=Camelina sativa TaxID=90675 RepID=A0ABM1QZ16_CAMSA|nr:PREDICTED: uncharacterized protein LOC104745450 isoform X2 [Camelina sativa]
MVLLHFMISKESNTWMICSFQFWRMFQRMMEMYIEQPAATTVLVLLLCMVVGKSLCSIVILFLHGVLQFIYLLLNLWWFLVSLEILIINLFCFWLKEEAPFTISDLSEDNNMLDSNYGDDLSSEELVLQDLQRASQKLTDETRKCFRDTFYRLARSSQDKSDSVSTNSDELLMQTSRYDYGDGNSYLIAG